jgi:GT2 family glycosyltransferase
MSRSLTVSIVNAKQWAWLEPCLRSVFAEPYTLGRFEVVVLDNASDDGSVERLREQFPDVRVLAETVRRGFGANHGVVTAEVDTDLVLFLNPDTVMRPGTLDRLAEAFDADERVAIAGGPIINPDGTVWRAAPFPFPSPVGALREAVGLHRLEDVPVAPAGVSVEVGWLSGSALMVDRAKFTDLGGFDPQLFMYFEETDLAKRCTDGGGRIAFHADAPVVHEGKTSERGIDDGTVRAASETKTTTEFERSAVKYMRKHHGRSGALVYRLALLIGASIRWAATYVPPLAGRLEVKAGSPAATRAHHRRRMGVALRPLSGVSIGDTAAAYNAIQEVADE